MSVLFVVLMGAGVLILFGICCEIANEWDRKKERKMEEERSRVCSIKDS
jgi:hypothetical protein